MSTFYTQIREYLVRYTESGLNNTFTFVIKDKFNPELAGSALVLLGLQRWMTPS